MSNFSFIARTRLLSQWNFSQDWFNGIMSSYFIQEFRASFNQWNNIFIGKQWLKIFQTSPRHAKNVKYSSNKENIMENFCPNFMISIHGKSMRRPHWTMENTSDNEAPVTLLALMIIDPATSWFVITPLPNKGSETIAIAYDQQWLCKYPRPLQCIHDNGTEFVGILFQ